MSQQDDAWLVLRHVEHEHIGTMASVFDRAGIPYRYTDLFRGEMAPQDSTGIGGLIVMGGPMGVYESDRYPFLKDEQALIRQAARQGSPVLGICLGAQLIASALGANVYPGYQKEIGWYEVEVTAPGDDFTAGLPASFMGFHWHGDTFDLPPGAVRLFRSRLYENQGFRCGRNVLALQFHLEVSAAMIREWLEDGGCRAELAALPDIHPEVIQRQTEEWAGRLTELSENVFSRFVKQDRPEGLFHR